MSDSESFGLLSLLSFHRVRGFFFFWLEVVLSVLPFPPFFSLACFTCALVKTSTLIVFVLPMLVFVEDLMIYSLRTPSGISKIIDSHDPVSESVPLDCPILFFI